MNDSGCGVVMEIIHKEGTETDHGLVLDFVRGEDEKREIATYVVSPFDVEYDEPEEEDLKWHKVKMEENLFEAVFSTQRVRASGIMSKEIETAYISLDTDKK